MGVIEHLADAQADLLVLAPPGQAFTSATKISFRAAA